MTSTLTIWVVSFAGMLTTAATAGSGVPSNPLDNPPGYTDSGHLGASLAVSGQWAVAGAPINNNGDGSVFLWQRDSSFASQWAYHSELSNLGGDGGMFGTSVDIDGDWIAVGTPDYIDPDQGRTGAVMMYELQDDNTWTRQQTLQPKFSSLHIGEFGSDVSLHLPWLVVGIPNADFPGATEGGCAALFRWNGSEWANVNYIIPPWDLTPGAQFGHSVAVTEGAIAIGAPYQNTTAGDPNGGQVFLLDQDGWYVDDYQSTTSSGYLGISLDADGGWIAAGHPGDNAVELFRDSSYEDSLVAGGVTNTGWSVAISASDSGTPMNVAGSSPSNSDITSGGHVRVWTRNEADATWDDQWLVPLQETPVLFGTAVALHKASILAGDPYTGDYSQGTAWASMLNSTSWIGPSGGNWTTTTNWTTGVPAPGVSAMLAVGEGPEVQIVVDDSPQFDAIRAGTGTVVLSMDGMGMQLDGDGVSAMTVGPPEGSGSTELQFVGGVIDALSSIHIGTGDAPATMLLDGSYMAVDGDVELGEAGTYSARLDGSSQLFSSGTATMSGGLTLLPTVDFSPIEGESFMVVDAAAIPDPFAMAVVPSVPDHRLVIDYSSGTSVEAIVELYEDAAVPTEGGGDSTSVPPNDIHAADLTGNGRAELILSLPAAPGGAGFVRIVEFNDAGAVVSTTDIGTSGASPNALDTADLTNDGLPEILVTEGAETLGMITNSDGDTNNMQYQTVYTWAGADLTDVVAIDWDGTASLVSGGPGAVVISATGSIRAMKNDGAGGLSPRPDVPIGEDPDDGDPANTEEPKKGLVGVGDAEELIVTVRGSQEIVVLGTLDGFNLEVQQRHNIGCRPSGLTVGDFNNDTWDDVLVTGESGGALRLLLGTESSGLSDAIALPVIPAALDAVAIDANDDGLLDVAVVVDDGLNTGIGLLRNDMDVDGNLVFTWRTPDEMGLLGVTQIGSGDLDGNGVNDLVTGGAGTAGLRNLGCPPGEILDCFGNCAPEDWLGDGVCDDGKYEWNGVPIYFNCSEFNCDDGDCLDCVDTGACCFLSGACIDDLPADLCMMKGGTWAGEGTFCNDVDCNKVTSGACCVDESTCTETDSLTCNDIGGSFNGGLTCAEVDCSGGGGGVDGGACCVDDLCSQVDSMEDCSGTYYEGEPCGLLTCTMTGMGAVGIFFDPSADPGGPCPGDFDENGDINVDDLLSLIGDWGGSASDLNDDGTVNIDDLLILLAAWGPCD